jgi:hypothetical protein
VPGAALRGTRAQRLTRDKPRQRHLVAPTDGSSHRQGMRLRRVLTWWRLQLPEENIMIETSATGRLALAAFAGLLWAGVANAETVQGSGRVAADSRPLAHFNAVALALPAHVEVHLGDSESVAIEADDNLMPLIETSVEKGTLRIHPARDNLELKAHTLKIVVNAKQVERIALGGSGSVVADVLRAPQLKFQIGGSGSIDVARVECESAAASLGGSGHLKLAGKAKELIVKIGGSGAVLAGGLHAHEVSVSTAGSGEATVWAEDALRVSSAGSGDVGYYGDPKVTTVAAGSGSVKRLGSGPH